MWLTTVALWYERAPESIGAVISGDNDSQYSLLNGGDTFAGNQTVESMLFSGYDVYFEGDEPPGL